MDNKHIKKLIPTWGCNGFFGYGQGRSVAEVGESEVGDVSVCHQICPKSDKCRAEHASKMDGRFPQLSEIVKKTVAGAMGAGLPVVQMTISAMNVAVKRENVEALRLQEGLLKFGVDSMTDHYVYGQLENVDNGINRRDPATKPSFILIGAKL